MGNRVQDKPHPLTLARADSWFSNTTGLGGPQDKGARLFHRKDPPISRALAESLSSDSGIGSAIIDEILNDAFAPGWKITLPSVEDSQEQRDSAAKAAEINARLTTWHARTRFVTEVKRHKRQNRAYGGAILLLGLDDGGDAMEPLGEVKAFTWVQTFDRYDASGSGAAIGDPSSVHFTFPAHYLIGTIMAGQTNQANDARALGFSERAIQERTTLSPNARSSSRSQIIHADRVWRSDGPYLSNRTRIENDGWGDSALQRVVHSVKGWDTTQQNIRHHIQDFVQVVYGIKGFQQLMLSNSEAAIVKRFALMDRIRSSVNAVIHDADGETVSKTSSSVSGLPDLVDRQMLDVSASSRIPITRLFGPSPGGFGTGESEGLNWRQQVESYRTDDLLPLLQYVYGLLFQTKEFADVPEGWGIKFGAIDSPTEQQQSDTRKTTAETDQIYVATGVLDATEVKASRFAGAEYSAETTVSLDKPEAKPTEGVAEEAERLNAEAAVDPNADPNAFDATGQGTEGKVQDTALNGAQVTALLELVKEVGANNIPAESAIQIALVAYPTIDPEEARRMFEPAERLAQTKPDPVPATIPVSAPTRNTSTDTTRSPSSPG